MPTRWMLAGRGALAHFQENRKPLENSTTQRIRRKPAPQQQEARASREGGLCPGHDRSFDASLLERGRYRRERGVELGSERADHRDDGNRDAGRDETILDGGRAGFVDEEAIEDGHDGSPCYFVNVAQPN